MITVRHRCQTRAGTRSLRNGQMIRSGFAAATSLIMSASLVANTTPTSCPASRKAHHTR
jgi:hypothetical protein